MKGCQSTSGEPAKHMMPTGIDPCKGKRRRAQLRDRRAGGDGIGLRGNPALFARSENV